MIYNKFKEIQTRLDTPTITLLCALKENTKKQDNKTDTTKNTRDKIVLGYI